MKAGVFNYWSQWCTTPEYVTPITCEISQAPPHFGTRLYRVGRIGCYATHTIPIYVYMCMLMYRHIIHMVNFEGETVWKRYCVNHYVNGTERTSTLLLLIIEGVFCSGRGRAAIYICTT